MTAFGLLEIQKGIYSLLQGDSALDAMVSGVYDRVPEQATFPYIVIGNGGLQDWSTTTTGGCEMLAEVLVYSRGGGREQALDIMNRIHTLFHDGNVTMIGHSLVQSRMESSDISLLADGFSYRGHMIFRLLTVEA